MTAPLTVYPGAIPVVLTGATISTPVVAPNGTAGNPGGSLNFTTGNGGSGNTNGGDYVITLGTGVGTGRGGQLQINGATIVTAPTDPLSSSGWVQFNATITTTNTGQGKSVYSTLTATGLSQNYAGTSAALDGIFFTDTSAFSYTGIIRGTMGHVEIQTATGSTITQAEGLAGVINIDAGADGTLTQGYGTGGEINNSSATYTVAQGWGGWHNLQTNDNGNFTNGYSVTALAQDTALKTGTIQNWRGVFAQLTRNNASTATTAWCFYGTVQNKTAGGAVTTGGGLYIQHRGNTTGTWATAYGVFVDSWVNSTGLITTVYGTRVNNQGGSNTTKAVGMYIQTQANATHNINFCTGASTPSGTWNIYSDSTSNNALAGPLTLGGTAAPTAASLTMAAGWDILPAAGSQAMIAGFVYIAAAAGAPSGVPTNVTTGHIPLYYDVTNNFLYVYNSGWKKSTVYA